MRRHHHRGPRPTLIPLRAGALLLFAVGALLAPAVSLAHGPAPAPLSVLGPSGGGSDARPSLLLTNIGLARADDDGDFVYGCPSEWDRDGDGEYDVVTPLAAATGDRVVVAGDPDLYVSTDGGCSFTPTGGLLGEGPSTLALITHLERVWALIDRGETRELVTTHDANVVASLTGDIHSVLGLASGELLLAGVVPGQAPQLRLVTVSAGGDVVDERLVSSPSPELSRVKLRYAEVAGGVDLWLSASVSGGVTLWKTDGETVVELLGPQVAVHGPISLCGGVVYAAGGDIVTDEERPPACDLSALDAAQVRCLAAAGDDRFVCDTFTLRRLREEGGAVVLDEAYTLDQMGPPELTCLEGERADRCESSWVHFGAEAGLLPDPEPGPDPGPVPQGCFGSPATMMLLLVPLWRRRRQRSLP